MSVSRGLMNVPGFNGSVADTMLAHRMDLRCLRPWRGRDGNTYITVRNKRGKDENRLVTNAPTSVPYDSWKLFDDLVVQEARRPLRVVGDLMSEGLVRNIANGMSYSVIQHNKMSSYQKAILSMSPLRQGERARPQIEPVLTPMPLVHADASFDVREIWQASRAGWDLDTTQLEEGARSIGEEIEDLTIGTLGSYSYGGGTIYGLTNHPSRITTTITTPTGGWTPDVAYDEVLDMVKLAMDNNIPGPFGLYFSNDWWKPLNVDYSAAYPGYTLMRKLRELPDINWVRTIPRLTGTVAILVRLSRNTITMIQGARIRTYRWESHGGFQINLKILGMLFPQIKDNSDNDAGIVHAVGV